MFSPNLDDSTQLTKFLEGKFQFHLGKLRRRGPGAPGPTFFKMPVTGAGIGTNERGQYCLATNEKV